MAAIFSARAFRNLLIAAMLPAIAACAGGARPEMARLPVVTDPAPIVSGTMRAYQVRGRWYRPAEQPGYDETGLASWYGDQFNGRPTATGERFDMHALTAAHKTLPLPGLVEVTNLANGRRVVVRVNDRGPFVDNRIIDLSRGAAEALLGETRFNLPVDHLLFNPNNSPLFAALSPWQLVPAIARQTEFVGEKSDIEGTRVGLRRLDWTYIRRELVRFAYDLRLLPMQFMALRRGAKFIAMRTD